MASIDRWKGNQWRARWRDPDGASKSKVCPRKVDAERFLTSIEHRKLTGTYVDVAAGKQTFKSYADEWAAAQDWKDSSREGWPYVLARLDSRIGKQPLAAIDRLALQGLQRSLAADYARSTVTLTMAYATMVMRAAYMNGRIGRDPTAGLRGPKARAGESDGKVGPEQVPTRAEALAILGAAPPSFRAAIALGLTGLRVGEVIGLTVDRVELDKREVTIDRQLQRIGNEMVFTTPKAEKARAIVVPGAVAFELRRHLRDHQGDGLLFRGVRGTPMLRRDQFYASAWHPALVGAGLAKDRFVFHSLRHFCASTLLAEGAPLTAVAGHLGDTVETVSRTYVHWLRDDRSVPADVLDRVLAPSSRVTDVSHPTGTES
jgi:integrase